MNRWLLSLLILLLNCKGDPSLNSADSVLEIRAQLYGNALPVDGCDAHFWLTLSNPSSDSRTFIRIPTEATRSLLVLLQLSSYTFLPC